MRKITFVFLAMLACMMVATPAFAAEAPAAAAGHELGGHHLRLRTGDSPPAWPPSARAKSRRAACEGMARNPAARTGIQMAMILGLAFIESLVLFTLVVVFVKVK